MPARVKISREIVCSRGHQKALKIGEQRVSKRSSNTGELNCGPVGENALRAVSVPCSVALPKSDAAIAPIPVKLPVADAPPVSPAPFAVVSVPEQTAPPNSEAFSDPTSPPVADSSAEPLSDPDSAPRPPAVAESVPLADSPAARDPSPNSVPVATALPNRFAL